MDKNVKDYFIRNHPKKVFKCKTCHHLHDIFFKNLKCPYTEEKTNDSLIKARETK